MKKTYKTGSLPERYPNLFISILAVAIILEIIVAFGLLGEKKTTSKSPNAQIATQATADKGTKYSGKLFLQPKTLPVKPGQSFEVSIIMNAQGYPVNAADAILSYDPNLLVVEESPLPGQAFPLYPRKLVDSQNGRIIITGTQQKKSEQGLTGNQVFAIIKFKALKKGTAQINLVSGPKGATSEGSAIIAAGTSQNILGEVDGAQVVIN